MSANGYIAGKDGGEEFLPDEHWKMFVGLAMEKGNFIYGKKTYEAVSTWGKEYRDDLKSIPTKVCVSKSAQGERTDDFIFVASPGEALEKIAENGHTEALLIGGSTINSAFAKEGLIDEIIFNVEPYILGEGIPVFKPEEFGYELRLIEHKVLSAGILQSHYALLK